MTDLASDLTNELRLVQSGNSITVDTSGNLVIINAVTGNLSVKQDSISFPLSTGSGGTGRSTVGSAHTLLGVASDGSSLFYYALLASDNAVVTKSGTGIFISALTNAGGGSGTVSAGSAGNLSYYPSAGTTVDDLVIGSALTILSVNSSGASHDYKVLSGGNNVTISYSGTSVVISATTGGAGTGTVNAGSQNYLAYYPSAGTTVDDVTVSVSTGGGIAPFNISILTSPAASVSSGDFWFQSSSNKVYLVLRSGNFSYYVELGS